MTDVLRAVVVHDRVHRGHPGKRCFIAPGKPRHKVRFDKPQQDAAIRFAILPVEMNIITKRRLAHAGHGFHVTALMIEAPVTSKNLGSHHTDPFLFSISPMRSRARNNHHILRPHVIQFGKQPTQQTLVWQRPRDIRNDHRQGLVRPNTALHRRTTDGRIHGLAKRSRLVLESIQKRRCDHRHLEIRQIKR